MWETERDSELLKELEQYNVEAENPHDSLEREFGPSDDEDSEEYESDDDSDEEEEEEEEEEY